MAGRTNAERRESPRYSLPAMYTLVRVRAKGNERYRWIGYIYDISESGMRFELDSALEPGTEIEVRAMLPGFYHTTFQASGRVVRVHDDAGFGGPMRMGMAFESFARDSDKQRLNRYLSQPTMKKAA